MFTAGSRFQVISLLGTLLIFNGCGGGGGGAYNSGATTQPPTPPPANVIYVGQASDVYGTPGDNVFSPTTLSVSAGTVVTFIWKASGHTVESGTGCTGDGSFTSAGVQSTGYQKAFTVPAGAAVGTNFRFLCQTHCSTPMACTITVK